MTSSKPAARRRTLLIILLVALALRLIYALAQNHTSPYTPRGGDSLWYLANGYTLVTGNQTDFVVELSRLPTAPLSLVTVGVFQALFTRAAGAIIAIRLVQVLISTGIVYGGYRLAYRITRNTVTALLAAGLLAISLSLIIESAQILTETLYMGFLFAGLVVFVDAVTAPEDSPVTTRIIIAGVLLGLATLTRAVLLFFPVGLALHWILARGWRPGWKHAVLLLSIYALMVSTWTVYNLARWNRFIVGAEGMTSFIYLGSRGWNAPEVVDQQLIEDLDSDAADTENGVNAGDYLDATKNVISSDPVAYVTRRVKELGQAYAQPHNTTRFSGDSLKDILSAWIKNDRTPGGLLDLMQRDEFWPKLVLYLFHYSGLLLGGAGIWLTRAQWRATLPLIGLIAYTSLLHLVMLALPRYLFPLYPIWWVFAACTLVRGRTDENVA